MVSTGPATTGQVTEARNAAASAIVAAVRSIGISGLTSNVSHGVQTSVIAASTSASSVSTRPIPPVPSANPDHSCSGAGGSHLANNARIRAWPASEAAVSLIVQVTKNRTSYLPRPSPRQANTSAHAARTCRRLIMLGPYDAVPASGLLDSLAYRA